MRRDLDSVIAPVGLFSEEPWGKAWSSQGIIQLLEGMVSDERKARLHAVLQARVKSVTVLMDAPHDPHNGAAVLRSCDAFGVQEAHVIPRDEQFLASNLVSKGAERWVDVIEHSSAERAASALTERGFELVATHPEGECTPEDLAEIPKVALVMGNERDGIRQSLMQSAGRSVRIPMVGFVESLNVSVSAAILLRAAAAHRPGDLSAAECQRLYARGLYRTVNRAKEIVLAANPNQFR